MRGLLLLVRRRTCSADAEAGVAAAGAVRCDDDVWRSADVRLGRT